MATTADLDELALAMPQTTKELSDDGRPTYLVHGKFFCFHRNPRRDAIDPDTGERLDDVLVFRVADVGVKELMLADDTRVVLHDTALGRLLRRAHPHPGSCPPRSRRAGRRDRRGMADEGAEARREAWLDAHGLTDD